MAPGGKGQVSSRSNQNRRMHPGKGEGGEKRSEKSLSLPPHPKGGGVPLSSIFLLDGERGGKKREKKKNPAQMFGGITRSILRP